MKKACFPFLSVLLALIFFTACSTPNIVAEFGELLQIERPDSNKNNDTSASKGQPQTNEEISNYKAIVQSLGSLLAQNWDTPKILTSTDIVTWYAEFLKQQHPNDESYLSQYAGASIHYAYCNRHFIRKTDRDYRCGRKPPYNNSFQSHN